MTSLKSAALRLWTRVTAAVKRTYRSVRAFICARPWQFALLLTAMACLAATTALAAALRGPMLNLAAACAD